MFTVLSMDPGVSWGTESINVSVHDSGSDDGYFHNTSVQPSRCVKERHLLVCALNVSGE